MAAEMMSGVEHAEGASRLVARTAERYHTVQQMVAAGRSLRRISRELNLDYYDVRRWARTAGPRGTARPGVCRAGVLDAFEPYLYQQPWATSAASPRCCTTATATNYPSGSSKSPRRPAASTPVRRRPRTRPSRDHRRTDDQLELRTSRRTEHQNQNDQALRLRTSQLRHTPQTNPVPNLNTNHHTSDRACSIGRGSARQRVRRHPGASSVR